MPCDEDEGDEVAEDVVVGEESSAPQPVNAMLDATVAMATKAALARRLSLFISSSVFCESACSLQSFQEIIVKRLRVVKLSLIRQLFERKWKVTGRTMVIGTPFA